MYHLKARYHKSGEKNRHFSYLDYFTYPVCQDQPMAKGVQVIEVTLYWHTMSLSDTYMYIYNIMYMYHH